MCSSLNALVFHSSITENLHGFLNKPMFDYESQPITALIMWSIENVQIISQRVQINLKQNTNPIKRQGVYIS